MTFEEWYRRKPLLWIKSFFWQLKLGEVVDEAFFDGVRTSSTSRYSFLNYMLQRRNERYTPLLEYARAYVEAGFFNEAAEFLVFRGVKRAPKGHGFDPYYSRLNAEIKKWLRLRSGEGVTWADFASSGSPGVSKTVHAQAMANLFKLSEPSLDFDDEE